MADGQRVEPAELRGYAGLLERQAQHFQTIERHARERGGDTSGYTGLLSLLVPVVNGVVGLYAETLQFADQKMTEVREGLEKVADDYQQRDDAASDQMNKLARDLDTVGSAD